MNSSIFLHSELPLKLETSQLISVLRQLESVGWTEQNQTELVHGDTREIILQVSQITCSLTSSRNILQTLINDMFCECSDCWLWNIHDSKWRRKTFWQKQQTNFWQLPSKPLENSHLSLYRLVSSTGISFESLLTPGIETILIKDLTKCKIPVA